MNSEISREQELLQENIFKSAGRIDNNLPFRDRWKIIAGTGIIGTCVETDYGGTGLGSLEMLLALEALARGNTDNGLSFAIAAHTLSCVIPIQKFGTAEQKKKLLPGMINGELIAANAMTESESGSDAFNMQCKAIKKGGRFLLNGNKTFISNSALSNLALTYAITNPDKGFFGGITAFIVDSKKYKVGSQFEKMGLKSCSLGELVFSDVIVEEEDILGKEGGGPVIFNHSMEWERICLTGIHLGAMHRVMDKTIDFVNHRKSSGQLLSKHQGISHAIAEMEVLQQTSRCYAIHAARVLDNQKSAGKEAAIAKLYVSNSVKEFMLKAMQIFGGYGYLKDFGIEKEVRDSLAATIYSGTSEIQKNIIASTLGI